MNRINKMKKKRVSRDPLAGWAEIFVVLLAHLDQSGTIRVFEKNAFAMDGRTRWQPEVREDAMHRFAF
jgi:hypothetical protein